MGRARWGRGPSVSLIFQTPVTSGEIPNRFPPRAGGKSYTLFLIPSTVPSLPIPSALEPLHLFLFRSTNFFSFFRNNSSIQISRCVREIRIPWRKCASSKFVSSLPTEYTQTNTSISILILNHYIKYNINVNITS